SPTAKRSGLCWKENLRSPAGEWCEVRSQRSDCRSKIQKSQREGFHLCNLTSDLCNCYIMSSLALRAIGCCITSSSFFTRFSPYTHCSNCCESCANSGATLAYSKCSNFETM